MLHFHFCSTTQVSLRVTRDAGCLRLHASLCLHLQARVCTRVRSCKRRQKQRGLEAGMKRHLSPAATAVAVAAAVAVAVVAVAAAVAVAAGHHTTDSAASAAGKVREALAANSARAHQCKNMHAPWPCGLQVLLASFWRASGSSTWAVSRLWCIITATAPFLLPSALYMRMRDTRLWRRLLVHLMGSWCII